MTTLTTVKSDLSPIDELARNAQRALSFASPDVAARRSLGEVVAAALDAATESAHTRRSYEIAIALFIHFLEGERGDLVPDRPETRGWRPFVQKEVDRVLVEVTADTGRAKSTYVYSEAWAGVLRLVDAGLLDAFRVWRLASGDSKGTARIRLYGVQTFLRVALRDGVLTRDQATNMGLKPYRQRQEREQGTVGRRLSRNEVRRLRAAVDSLTNKGKRDLAIFDFALYLGLRESEIAGIKMSDLQQDGGRWWAVIRGKRGKTRRLKVHDVLYKSLVAWAEVAGLVWHDERAVFYSVNKGDQVNDRSITATDVGRLVASCGAKAGLSPARGKGRLGAHDLRRTCARNAYDNGAMLLQVQQMLGHADIKTTTLYIGLDQDDTDTAVDYVRY